MITETFTKIFYYFLIWFEWKFELGHLLSSSVWFQKGKILWWLSGFGQAGDLQEFYKWGTNWRNLWRMGNLFL